jgi:hypothetical protein
VPTGSDEVEMMAFSPELSGPLPRNMCIPVGVRVKTSTVPVTGAGPGNGLARLATVAVNDTDSPTNEGLGDVVRAVEVPVSVERTTWVTTLDVEPVNLVLAPA